MLSVPGEPVQHRTRHRQHVPGWRPGRKARVPALGGLPTTGWRVQRRARSESPQGATVVTTLEDTPFYARSLVGTRLFGAETVAVHESLSMERFASPWVQTLLPFRIRKHRSEA